MSNSYHYRKYSYASMDHQNQNRSQSLEITSQNFNRFHHQSFVRQKNKMQVESGVSYASPQESPIHKISAKLSKYLQQTQGGIQDKQKCGIKKTKNEQLRKQSVSKIKGETCDRFNYFKQSKSSAIKPVRNKTIRKYLINNWSPFPQNTFNKSCTLQHILPSKLLDKPKSMLIIQRQNKIKERNSQNYQLQRVQQIPIHHTMFHFRKGPTMKIRTETTNFATIEGKTKIDRKINQAVQQIIKLRRSLRDTTDSQFVPVFDEESGLIGSSIFIQQQKTDGDQRTKDCNLAYKKQKKVCRLRGGRHRQFVDNNGQQQQISPWNRRSNTNDFQLAL